MAQSQESAPRDLFVVLLDGRPISDSYRYFLSEYSAKKYASAFSDFDVRVVRYSPVPDGF